MRIRTIASTHKSDRHTSEEISDEGVHAELEDCKPHIGFCFRG